jgi:hypothetical protein
VKFFELEPLNARKDGGYAATREANSRHSQKAGGSSARNFIRRRKIAPSHPEKRRMDMSLVTAAPLGLGVLIALGGILVMMSYLSE